MLHMIDARQLVILILIMLGVEAVRALAAIWRSARFSRNANPRNPWPVFRLTDNVSDVSTGPNVSVAGAGPVSPSCAFWHEKR